MWKVESSALRKDGCSWGQRQTAWAKQTTTPVWPTNSISSRWGVSPSTNTDTWCVCACVFALNVCVELVGGEGEGKRGEGEGKWLFYTLVLDTNSECSRQGLTCCLGNTLHRRNILVLPR